jgi:putative hydrolase of the HAD superfamily
MYLADIAWALLWIGARRVLIMSIIMNLDDDRNAPMEEHSMDFPMSRPDMMVFDFGDTLVKITGYRPVEAIRRLLSVCRNPEDVTAEEVAAKAAEMNHALWGAFPQPVLEAATKPFQRYLLESFGIEILLPPETLEDLFWEEVFVMEAAPGISSLLEACRETGIRVGIISNITFSGRHIEQALAQNIPGAAFEFILASSDYLYRKPDPALFRLALKKARLPAERVWYLGDRPEYDVAGAASVGMFPVWYRGSFRREEPSPEIPHWEVGHWDEVTAWLREG